MSRGPGHLQQAIMAYVGESSEPITMESARWLLYSQLEKGTVPPEGEIPSAWNNSFRRAIDGLCRAHSEGLTVDKRPLANFEECITNYPGKTLNMATRKLRLELLPALLKWTKEPCGPSPRYTIADNEEYVHDRLPPGRINELSERWTCLEPQLRNLLAMTGSDNLLHLLCRGAALFRGVNIKSRCSLAESVAICCAGGLPDNLANDLRKFASDFVLEGQASHLGLKSMVHEFANVPRWGQCSLKAETIAALHRLCPEFVESLPGFCGPQPVTWSALPKHSSQLHKLFDQTVFQKFTFLSLVKQPPPQIAIGSPVVTPNTVAHIHPVGARNRPI